MDFGEKLKLLRYEKGLTQDDLGYLLGVTKSCVSCYEKGTRMPSIDILIELSSYFRVSIDFLLGTDTYEKGVPVKLTKKDISIINLLKDNPNVYSYISKNMNEWIKREKQLIKQ